MGQALGGSLEGNVSGMDRGLVLEPQGSVWDWFLGSVVCLCFSHDSLPLGC